MCHRLLAEACFQKVRLLVLCLDLDLHESALSHGSRILRSRVLVRLVHRRWMIHAPLLCEECECKTRRYYSWVT